MACFCLYRLRVITLLFFAATAQILTGQQTGIPGKIVHEPTQSLPTANSAPRQHDDAPEFSAYCDALSKESEHAAALSHVCKFAMTLSERIPNVICAQETLRYRDGGMDSGGIRLLDTVTAEVSFENGQEVYRNFTIDGRAIKTDAPNLIGGWTTGEFASDLRGIFVPESRTKFKFKKTEKIRSQLADVFEFQIAKQNNQTWHLQVGSYDVFPGYSGRLWIERSNSRLVRLEIGEVEIIGPSPLTYFKSDIDYSEVQLGDGTSFILPEQSQTFACRAANRKPCYRNLLTFRNWHKFAGKGRIVTDATP